MLLIVERLLGVHCSELSCCRDIRLPIINLPFSFNRYKFDYLKGWKIFKFHTIIMLETCTLACIFHSITIYASARVHLFMCQMFILYTINNDDMKDRQTMCHHCCIVSIVRTINWSATDPRVQFASIISSWLVRVNLHRYDCMRLPTWSLHWNSWWLWRAWLEREISRRIKKRGGECMHRICVLAHILLYRKQRKPNMQSKLAVEW